MIVQNHLGRLPIHLITFIRGEICFRSCKATTFKLFKALLMMTIGESFSARLVIALHAKGLLCMQSKCNLLLLCDRSRLPTQQGFKEHKQVFKALHWFANLSLPLCLSNTVVINLQTKFVQILAHSSQQGNWTRQRQEKRNKITRP